MRARWLGSFDVGSGYRLTRIHGQYIKEHRLAWFYMYGECPSEIDHINGVKDDNRICNLRPATHWQNSCNQLLPKNNKTGHKGVYFHKKNGRFVAQVGRRYLGSFATAEEAALAYDEAAIQEYGKYAKINAAPAA